jgi:hypothetical protein
MKNILLLGSLLLSLAGIRAQGFAGSIEFRYATQNDTTRNVYHVNNKLVKLDQYARKGNTNNVEGSFLFDLASGDIKFLNPKRKLWGRQKSETPQVITGQCVVTKGKNAKTIAGQKCTEYIVKNADENTIITYYITSDKFNFFIPLIKLWNRKDKQSIYFGQIKGLPEGSMPMMSEERQLDNNKLLTKLEVVKITKTAPSAAIFEVPKDYSKVE